MVNRILIRIKVVQLLYSYLLTRSEFHLKEAPGTGATRDALYAYSVYLRLLLFILEISGIQVQGPNKLHPLASLRGKNPLAGTRMAQSISSIPAVADIIASGRPSIDNLDPLALRLQQTIVNSSAFLDFKKNKKAGLADEVKLWGAVIPTVIANNPDFIATLRTDEGYTQRGFEQGVEMVLDTLSSFVDTRLSLASARNALQTSLDKAYELYHALLLLPVAITKEQEQRLEENRNKHMPTAEDLNPNLRFVNNLYPRMILENPDIKAYLKAHPISWDDQYPLIKGLLRDITESDLYRDYMAAPLTDPHADIAFWRSVMKQIILPSDDLAETLENSSVYWNDDLDIMGTFVTKTMRHMEVSGSPAETRLLPEFKDEEDAQFGNQLFTLAIDHADEYRALVDRFINRNQWESERLAFMDVVILIAAIAELVGFPKIPIPVTFNEYIEIARYYSTSRSPQFINGMLHSVIGYLQNEGIIHK
ncbi:MAG: transcription antitermination protein NusB [Bacteroidales bacterium]|nr:transcription antitermination protein NusB [Bacteroidales bacterium]